MSDFVIHKGRRAAGAFARHYGADVAIVHYEPGKPTLITLTDGRAGAGTCLGCSNMPCIEKGEAELALFGTFEVFPGDPSRDVCPTRAIHWDEGSSTALVIGDCIGCGLCISRCPHGAISLADGLAAQVETSDPDGLVALGPTQGEQPQVRRSGQIGNTDAPAASNLPRTIAALEDGRMTLMVRNILHEIGLNARTRRRGDTNMRIDAVGFSRSQRPFVAEIETGAGVLDSPRALLEDVAVLHSRYGYAVDAIDPISIILAFPNVRSEYYQVVRDIEKVIGLRCRTLTVGALVTLLWNFAQIHSFSGDSFMVGAEKIDLSDCLAKFLGVYPKKLIEPYPGAFTPAK